MPFRRTRDELTTSGVALSPSAGGEYQHPPNERFRLRAGGDLTLQDHARREIDKTTVSGNCSLDIRACSDFVRIKEYDGPSLESELYFDRWIVALSGHGLQVA